MKYLFILGRNIELSIAEIFSYFEKENKKILSSKLIRNGLLLELNGPLEKNIIDNFGGVISIGEVLAEGKDIEKKLGKIALYEGKNNKLTYAVWDFSPENYNSILEYLKKRFKSEKLKATLKHLTGTIKMQGKENFYAPSSKLISEEYFVFGEKEIFFGKIIQEYDSESLEKRDMNKPIRRESLAISPRLAKIMINLSLIKKNETLLDPFCGVGTILSEGLIQGMKVVGIDKDKNAINGARQNISWLGFSKEKYKLIWGDSTKEKIDLVNSIVTEPDLGETWKKMPTEKEAKKQIKKFENLIIKVLKNFKEKNYGRVVFTSPYIRVFKKRHKVDLSRILNETEYRMIYEIPEYRKNQIVGRMIYVLEK